MKCIICNKILNGNKKKFCSYDCQMEYYSPGFKKFDIDYIKKNKKNSELRKKEYNRQYILTNHEKVKLWKRNYYHKHKNEIYEKQKEYRIKNKDKVKKLRNKSFKKFIEKDSGKRFKELMKNNYNKNKTKYFSRKLTLKYNNNLIPLFCKECKTNENLSIHHEIYPTKKIEIISAIKNRRIYYLCKKHHIKIHHN